MAEVTPPRGVPEGGIWLRDPDDHLVNIRDEAAPAEPVDPPLTLNGPGYAARVAVRGAPERTAGVVAITAGDWAEAFPAASNA